MLRTVRAVRYVMPLREGGSLPAIVEGDDMGLYVLKFRGAGQGPLALVAELVGGEIGRLLGLQVPELVLLEVDSELGRNEPDQEIRELLKKSVGLNLALDFLPGSTMFDPAAGDLAEEDLASTVVWFDAFISNVDRTARNPNLLIWHRELRPIDHGAAMFWQHDWESRERAVMSGFPATRHHVLLPWAGAMERADERARARLGRAEIEQIVAEVPGDWLLPREGGGGEVAESGGLAGEAGFDAIEARRRAYVDFLVRRMQSSERFVKEAMDARRELV